MRRLLLIVALLFGVICAPRAYADTFDATFTCDSICVDTPADPPASFPSPTFPVNFFHHSFSMTLNALDKATDKFTWGVVLSASGWEFVIHDLTNGTTDTSQWFAFDKYGNPYGSGQVLFPSVATPEPNSSTLLLLGLGIGLLVWKFRGYRRVQST